MYGHAQQASVQIRIRTFDFLRGLAILGVIVVHTSQNFPSQINAIDFLASLGRFGVQMFYFVSAITLCHTWELREREINPIKNFYIRRFFRIAPLFWISIPVYLSLNGLERGYWAPEGVGALEIFLTVTFLHGFWPSSINSVVPGGWSIAVEMTFYALFPLLILKIRRRNVYLLLAFITWGFNIFIFRDFVENFLTNYYQTSSTTIIKDYLYLNFVNQVPIFFLGCYLYFTLNARPKEIEKFFFSAWLFIGAGLELCFDIEGFAFLTVFIALGAFISICIKANIRFKAVEELGKRSYAIYLVHFLVLHCLREIISLETGLLAFLISLPLVILISYALSLVMLQLIESRVQRFVDTITNSTLTHR